MGPQAGLILLTTGRELGRRARRRGLQRAVGLGRPLQQLQHCWSGGGIRKVTSLGSRGATVEGDRRIDVSTSRRGTARSPRRYLVMSSASQHRPTPVRWEEPAEGPSWRDGRCQTPPTPPEGPSPFKQPRRQPPSPTSWPSTPLSGGCTIHTPVVSEQDPHSVMVVACVAGPWVGTGRSPGWLTRDC
ncbi:MAG: hypothetical protein QOI36_2214 [Pseudonocardiales bacterium]|nr:hypothetical protein [Pseudonocardiales bacterium]